MELRRRGSTSRPAPRKTVEISFPAIDTRRALLRTFAVSLGGFTSFYLLVAAVPALGAELGGRFGAGLLTFLFMGATIVAQLCVPPGLRRWSYRTLLLSALGLLGAPAALYPLGGGLAAAAAITVLRGLGFGILTVVGSILLAGYARADARGSTFGAYGMMSAGTGVICPALGLFLYRHSPPAAFAVTTAVSLLTALVLVRPLAEPELPEQAPLSELAGDAGRLAYPTLVFFAAAFALGSIYTFLPLRGGRATVGLLAFGLAFAAGRKVGGISRGIAAETLALVLVGAGVAGTLALATGGSVSLFVGGALLAGLGIGGLCTLSLVVLVGRCERSLYSAVATAWNVVYDAGIALGGLSLGLVAAGVGLWATWVVAAAVFAAIAFPAAVLDDRARRARSALAG